MTLQADIDQACTLIGAVDSGDSATTAETADMLVAWNQMMQMWKQDDKDLQWPPQDTVADPYPLPLWTKEAVIYNLAVRAATIFDLPVPPDVAFLAREGKAFIEKVLINNKVLPLDMSHLPAGGGRWNILTDSIR